MTDPWPAAPDDAVDDVFGPDPIFDSDNWLRIPEFDVVPAPALDFRGYLDSDRAKHPELVAAARRLVRGARLKARRAFSRMHELRDAWAQYLEAADRQFGSDPELLKEMPAPSPATRVAVFYNLVIGHLEDGMRANTKAAAVAHFANAAGFFADWSEDDVSRPLPLVRSEAMRELAKRRKVKGTPELFAKFAHAQGFPTARSRKQLVADAQEYFSASDRTIERWYAAAHKKNLLP